MRRLVIALLVVWLAGVGVAAAAGATDDDMAVALEAYDGGDYATAIAAWRRAAAAGNTDAMTALANLYLQGEGVAPNAARSARLYRRAAERGDVVAQFNLGDMLSRGVGVPRDSVGASMWLGLAARRGQRWAARRRAEIARFMSAADIAAANAMIAAWRPRAP